MRAKQLTAISFLTCQPVATLRQRSDSQSSQRSFQYPGSANGYYPQQQQQQASQPPQQQQQQVGGHTSAPSQQFSGWRGVVATVGTASAAGVAIFSEESMKSLKYCLQWLQVTISFDFGTRKKNCCRSRNFQTNIHVRLTFFMCSMRCNILIIRLDFCVRFWSHWPAHHPARQWCLRRRLQHWRRSRRRLSRRFVKSSTSSLDTQELVCPTRPRSVSANLFSRCPFAGQHSTTNPFPRPPWARPRWAPNPTAVPSNRRR